MPEAAVAVVHRIYIKQFSSNEIANRWFDGFREAIALGRSGVTAQSSLPLPDQANEQTIPNVGLYEVDAGILALHLQTKSAGASCRAPPLASTSGYGVSRWRRSTEAFGHTRRNLCLKACLCRRRLGSLTGRDPLVLQLVIAIKWLTAVGVHGGDPMLPRIAMMKAPRRHEAKTLATAPELLPSA
jgi:hypothetical protein